MASLTGIRTTTYSTEKSIRYYFQSIVVHSLKLYSIVFTFFFSFRWLFSLICKRPFFFFHFDRMLSVHVFQVHSIRIQNKLSGKLESMCVYNLCICEVDCFSPSIFFLCHYRRRNQCCCSTRSALQLL